ncbi:MAG: hypothetical protein RI907_1539 [Pseudomonadota bacterium]|jgi:putative ubiquitin-RnfH superfamily antitoxin RatB of RatAB toxin-antitoxin module
MASAELQVEVTVGVAPGEVWRRVVGLPAGCTVAVALHEAGVWQIAGQPGPDQAWAQGWSVGVWGRKATLTQVLRDGDRLELVRPLKVDPKEARRVRYRAQGEKLPKGYHPPKDRDPSGR